MPAIGPIKRRDLIGCLRALGFEAPVSGGDHQYMKGRGRKLRIPNPHTEDIGRGLLVRILRQAGIERAEREGLCIFFRQGPRPMSPNRNRQSLNRSMLLPKTKLARFGLPPENSATSSPMARASVAVLLAGPRFPHASARNPSPIRVQYV